ncbi:MAG: glutamyl-tRNA reductase [Bacteroidales bacterium]
MIGVLGINHKTASQDVRGYFALAREDIVPFSELAQQKTEITELVVLSTCHRTELYYYHDKSCNKRVSKVLTELLHNFKKVPQNYEGAFYSYVDREAVKHLFRVTSGMDSLVIGEDQIVNQVKEAYIYCTEAVLTDAVLMRLFQKSFETSKRVRTETALQQGPSSVSNVAVDLCCKIFDDLPAKTVLFIGSGETGRLALRYMIKRGVTRIFVANRTYKNALALAQENRATVVNFDEICSHLPDCDIVIVATGARHHLLGKSDVETAMAERQNNRQVYIDLSVPRNIENSVSDLENVMLYGVDDMQQIVDSYSGRRMESMEQANEIVNELAEEYMFWVDCLALRPLIKTIKRNIRKIREDEMNIYKGMEDEQKLKLIDEYTNRITQKYINLIIKNLREVKRNRPASGSLNIISELFTVDEKQK